MRMSKKQVDTRIAELEHDLAFNREHVKRLESRIKFLERELSYAERVVQEVKGER